MSRAEPALFYWRDADGGWTYVLTYVDDFIFALGDLALYRLLIKAMEAAGWQVKEMGVPLQFLSLDMKLTLDPNGRCVKINLSQHTYILDLVEQFDLTLAANPTTTTPMAKCTAVDVSGQLLPSNSNYIFLWVH